VTGYRAVAPDQAGSTSAVSAATGGVQVAGLAEVLRSDSGRVLIGASVYREPADRNALLFQVGWPDLAAAWVPDRQGPVPPYREPAGLDDMLAECQTAGLLAAGFAVPQGDRDAQRPGRSDGPDTAGAKLPTVYVDRWTAGELHRMLEAANRRTEIAAAHRRAAEYWRWRAAAWPQEHHDDLHDLLEARHHLLEAGETQQACTLTEGVCSQLHAGGELGQEAALIGDTLVRLPERSAQRAAWIHELGTIAQVRADYAAAERCFGQALEIFTAADDRVGVARCHYSLGVLAQAQGEYARAEQCYRQSAEANDSAEMAGPLATPPTPLASLAAPLGARTRPAVTRPAPALAPTATRSRLLGPAAWRRLTGQAAQWRMPGLAGLAVGMLALSATEILTTLNSAGVASAYPVASPTSRAATAVRQEAAAWVADQISPSATVSCDPAMCAELQTRGFPAGDLVMLGPGASSPLSSDVVVATAAVRAEFGRSLADAYAPMVLASFGSGTARVEIRAVAPHGPVVFRDALAADLAARRRVSTQLLRNPHVIVAGLAREQLSAGLVDSRLLVTLAALAELQPVRILGFGASAPSASAGTPLREMEIAGPASAPGLVFMRAQQPPYLAALHAIRLPDGHAALRIGFAGPSPLGLLAAATPAALAVPPA
jgi:tetratricopeptide (TPR) repeat protein